MTEEDRPESDDGRAAIPREGDLIGGKYRVGGQLGAGGMGVVLAARHEGLAQHVAIKVLLPQATRSEEAVARFLREARTAAALQGEHVTRVMDVGTLPSGAPYMVMERLTGADLADVLAARGALPVNEAVRYVLEACQAMAEAHARGIVHRDLKPSNLFLAQRPDGAPFVKVLDFGISKVDDASLGEAPKGALTTTGAMIGSPIYMSPEQVRSSRKVDARTDVWSLGVILHELVSGRLPFEGDSLSGILAAIAADPATPLRTHRPDAPAGLEAVVLRCLEKDPTQRTQDIRTLVEDLRPYADRGLAAPRFSLFPRSGAAAPDLGHEEDETLPAMGEMLAGVIAAGQPAATPVKPDLEELGATQVAWGGSTTSRRRRRRSALVIAAAAAGLGGLLLLGKLSLGSRAATPDEASPAPGSSTSLLVAPGGSAASAGAAPETAPITVAAASDPAPLPSASASAPPATSARTSLRDPPRPPPARSAPTPPASAPTPAAAPPATPKGETRDPLLDRK
jgi:serine/threonine-protein kinase